MIVHYSFFNLFYADRKITFDEESKNVGESTIWYTAPGKVNGKDGEFILTIFNDGKLEPILEFHYKSRDSTKIMKTMHVSIN